MLKATFTDSDVTVTPGLGMVELILTGTGTVQGFGAATDVVGVVEDFATAPGRPAAIAPVRPAAVAPDQFSPFLAYAAFGWLPAGYTLLEGGTTRGSTYQVAGPLSLSTRPWYLLAYPAGGCQLTGARGIMCKAYYPFGPLALTSRAPDINRRRAYWAGAVPARAALLPGSGP
jgi:hypothetical protein